MVQRQPSTVCTRPCLWQAFSQESGAVRGGAQAAAVAEWDAGLVVETPGGGYLLAPVDALQGGTLNDAQRETVCAMRADLLALAEQAAEVV